MNGTEWQCDMGNGEWDHDWVEKSDSSGEVDGGPGDHWSWRECRECGEIENPLLAALPKIQAQIVTIEVLERMQRDLPGFFEQ